MPDFNSNEALSVVSSPRLHSLLRDVCDDTPAAYAQFWETIEAEGTPLIETIDNDPDFCIVTFLWRANQDLQQILLIIDTLTDQYRRLDLTQCFMRQVAGTNIWHLSYRLRTDLRATYHFYPVSSQQTALSPGAKTREGWLDILTHTLSDPLNQKTFPSRRSGENLSVLELPSASPQPWWQKREQTPEGVVTEHRLQSELLDNERSIWVYHPADYTPDHAPYPVLLLLDGQAWVQTIGIQTTLDNLIAANAVPPLIAIAIDSLDSETRGQELTCNPLFVRFLTDELLPWVGASWSITDNPMQTIIAGQSYGGLAAAFAGFQAPQRFGSILSQSGSFWWKTDDPNAEDSEWLAGQFALAAPLPLRFYVTVGWQEWMMLAPNRHLRDVLLAKRYSVIYSEYNGGHDYICWRGSLADGLIALTQNWHTVGDRKELPGSIHNLQVTGRSTIPPQKPKSPPPEVIKSPRIAALEAALETGADGALASFWARVLAEGTPLVEPIEQDAEHVIVTFLWRGDDLREVVILANKFTDASVFDLSLMERLPKSDVWHRSYRTRANWRASYKLAPMATSTTASALGAYVARLVERAIAVGSPVSRSVLEQWWYALEQAVPDPLNQKRFGDQSVVELPQAPLQRWFSPRSDVPAGSVTEHTIRSGILGNTRRVWVYTPANYAPEAPPHNVLVMLDGRSWIDEHPLQPTLDNLIAEGKLPPLVAVFPESLDFETRVREMACYIPFVEFLTEELLPWAATKWNIASAPEQTMIAGQSLGGLTAAFAGLLAPQRFGNILSQSGSFWWANGSQFDMDTEWLTQQYARLPKRALRFYIEVGLQEWVLLPPTRHLRRVLEAGGYEVTYSEFNGGHDELCFRGSIADGLLALTQS